jgi:segregation and condensation protein A
VAYRVKTEAFEGPFDLLLYLVSRKKVDIGAISVSEIADQYLAEISRMGSLDLDVASDFLVVAATLLELKAQNLLPAPVADDDDDAAADVMSPAQAKLALIERLITYKQFKNAAGALDDMHLRASQMCPRPYGPTSDFADLMPDFLNGVPLERLAALAAGAFSRREVFLLESKHIASKPIPVEACVSSVMQRLHACGRMNFSEICRGVQSKELLVANFLALLELYKRRLVDLRQMQTFGDIEVELLSNTDKDQDAQDTEGEGVLQAFSESATQDTPLVDESETMLGGAEDADL